MMVAVVRTFVMYVFIIIAMRVMGKRTIGEMHPVELVVSIMISDIATSPILSEKTPLLMGIVPVIVLIVSELFFSFLILKSRVARSLFVGKSLGVVKKGRLVEKDMAKLRVTVDDVEEQVRIAGFSSVNEVREVIVETNGQVSVIAKEEPDVPYPVIIDGRLLKKEMENAKISPEDISKELKKHGINSVKDVLYMSAEGSRVVFFQGKNK